MGNSLLQKPLSSPAKAKQAFKRGIIIAALLVLVLVSGLAWWWSRSPVHLIDGGAQARALLLQDWNAGESIVLIRHAERCDRSSNPCLGPADGITRAGSEAAKGVGQGMMRMGMDQADVFSSPVTRTVQTTQSMFEKDPQTLEWLATCGSTFDNDMIARKHTGRNLVLVTHSGCIADLEKQLGFAHTATSEYGSALFLHLNKEGKLSVTGIVNANDWTALLQ